jgi:hypothetical protein
MVSIMPSLSHKLAVGLILALGSLYFIALLLNMISENYSYYMGGYLLGFALMFIVGCFMLFAWLSLGKKELGDGTDAK